MNTKVNLKARINRHSKIIKNGLSDVHPLLSIYRHLNYSVVIVVVIFIMPIYPAFSILFSPANQFDFNRDIIDENSIIDSYDASYDIETIWSGWYINIQTLLDDSRNTEWVNEIIEYEIQLWDSFSSLADKFRITKDSIYWANNYTSSTTLIAWQTIKIPSISGIIHKIESWETIDSISKKYWINKDQIISQNSIEDLSLMIWKSIIIPWAKKVVPKKYSTSYDFAKSVWASGQSTYVENDNRYPYQLVKRPWVNRFVWWNCTYFVAAYKNVTWRWNAKDWYRNAQAAWVATWTNPWIWSIVVLNWKWYNPRYGHVWIVVDVTTDKIVVKDMNYRRLNEVTTREIPKNDRAITWYIYVD